MPYKMVCDMACLACGHVWLAPSPEVQGVKCPSCHDPLVAKVPESDRKTPPRG